MSHRANRGFTLLEILVVVLILGLLVAFVAPQVINRKDRANWDLAKARIATLEQAVEMFKLDNGRLPDDGRGPRRSRAAPAE